MQSSIKEEFVPALAREANKRVVGDPTNDASVIGPLIEPSALDRVLGYVQQARADGARIVTGGEKLLAETGGYFTGATVIND